MFLVLFLVLAIVLYFVLLVFIVLSVLLVLVIHVLSVLVFSCCCSCSCLKYDICHAPCHFLWKFTCKMPDAPDTTSIDRRTFTITVRTPLAFLVAILVVLVPILRVLMFLISPCCSCFLTRLLLFVAFTRSKSHRPELSITRAPPP